MFFLQELFFTLKEFNEKTAVKRNRQTVSLQSKKAANGFLWHFTLAIKAGYMLQVCGVSERQ